MRTWRCTKWTWMLVALIATGVTSARADVVTHWNAIAAEIASKPPGTPPAVRTLAIVQVSAFEAVNAITGRYGAPHRAERTASRAPLLPRG